MARCTEQYAYDAVGNVLRVQYVGADSAVQGGTGLFAYPENSNRLFSTSIGSVTANYDYSGNPGSRTNMTSMPGLQQLDWDENDWLHRSIRQRVNGAENGSPETTCYVYGENGTRIRKATDRQTSESGPVSRTRLKERLYIDGWEVFRKYNGGGSLITLERLTLAVNGHGEVLVRIETRTQGTDIRPLQLMRYQLDSNSVRYVWN